MLEVLSRALYIVGAIVVAAMLAVLLSGDIEE